MTTPQLPSTPSSNDDEDLSPRIGTLQAQATRLDREASDVRQITARDRPSVAGPGGLYQPLGAASPITARGNTTSGATPVGRVVTVSQGQRGGMPRGDSVTPQQIRELQQKAAQIDYTAGAQVVTVDPNDVDPDADPPTVLPARRPGDLLVRDNEGVYSIYRWDNTARQWVGALTDEFNSAIAAPSIRQYPVITANTVRRRIEGLTVAWYNGDGTAGTAGAAALLADGAAVTFGETVLEIGDRLALNVTNAGAGDLEFQVRFTIV